jgi:hypothetical protein
MRMVPVLGGNAKPKLEEDQREWKTAGTGDAVNRLTPEMEARAGIEPTYKDLQSSA